MIIVYWMSKHDKKRANMVDHTFTKTKALKHLAFSTKSVLIIIKIKYHMIQN